MTVDSQVHGQQGRAADAEEPDLGGARPRVSVVVPALNEARNLLEVLPTLLPVEQVVLVDGGSVDGTVDAALSVLPHLDVVHQTRRGKGNALACGFEAVTGDIVVTFAADGSTDAAEMPRFIEALLAGADVAKGSRFLPGGGSEDLTRARDAGNRFLSRHASAMFDTAFTDVCYDYNAFWVDVLEELSLPDPQARQQGRGMPSGDGFEVEALISCRAAVTGLAITEVPSVERARLHGASHLRANRDGVRVLKAMYGERRRVRRLDGSGLFRSGARRCVGAGAARATAGVPAGLRPTSPD